MSSHSSGNRLEDKVRKLHAHEEVGKYPVQITGYYTKKTRKTKCYTPDLITPTRVLECKNAETTGVVEKLPQAVLKQKLLGDKTGKQPFLIYEGAEYEWYIHNDPIMLQTMELVPEVIVTSFTNYKENY